MTHAQLFRALADDARLHILDILREQDGTITVAALQSRLKEQGYPLEQSVISHHLGLLKRAGMVTCDEKRHFHHYVICHEQAITLARLIDYYVGMRFEKVMS